MPYLSDQYHDPDIALQVRAMASDDPRRGFIDFICMVELLAKNLRTEADVIMAPDKSRHEQIDEIYGLVTGSMHSDWKSMLDLHKTLVLLLERKLGI